jgi:ABC-type oligopeptide transport system substrate-binding subunit
VCAFSLTVALTASGCASVAKVTNLSEESCRTSFTYHLSSILTQESEKPEIADALAHKTISTLTTYDLGPRPFAIAAPSGADYRFFIDQKGADCVLILFGRRKGFISYTNNLTYIATEIVPDCTCAE